MPGGYDEQYDAGNGQYQASPNAGPEAEEDAAGQAGYGEGMSVADLFRGQEGAQPEQAQTVPKDRGRRLVKWLLPVMVLIAAAIFADVCLLRIDKIAIDGLVHQTWDTVIHDAGLQDGIHHFAATDETIKAAVEQNRYMKYIGIRKIFPKRMVIYVKERQILANVSLHGITYMLDETGMVLERNSTGALDDSLVYVTGLLARDSVFLGRELVPAKAEELECYKAVMNELVLQGVLGDVKELNVSDAENLYAVLRDGYTVMLGDDSDLRAKIGTARAVVSSLHEMQMYGGTLDASVPGEAVYQPLE